ncbi:MAG: ABC-type transport system involved in multi-copper enzyme maturation permease subunit [Candidatus Endobugula sp.]|jgi:ABC-type transport system involved in multi-copper enzyme maturation permease subunit
MDTYWWKENWQSPVITSNNYSNQPSLSLWIFFLASLGVCCYIFFTQRIELFSYYQKGNYTEMALLLILLAPLCLCIMAIKKMTSNVDFGDTPLIMRPFPAFMGKAFSGDVDIKRNTTKEKFFAELLLNKYSKNSTEESTKKMMWKMPVTVRQNTTLAGIRLSLEARLPDNAPPSTPPNNDEYHEWQLHIISDNQRFKRSWDIPIISSTHK